MGILQISKELRPKTPAASLKDVFVEVARRCKRKDLLIGSGARPRQLLQYCGPAAPPTRGLKRHFCTTTMAPNALTHIVSGHHLACELQIGVYDGISTSTTNDQQLALLEGFVGAAPKGRAREKLP